MILNPYVVNDNRCKFIQDFQLSWTFRIEFNMYIKITIDCTQVKSFSMRGTRPLSNQPSVLDCTNMAARNIFNRHLC